MALDAKQDASCFPILSRNTNPRPTQQPWAQQHLRDASSEADPHRSTGHPSPPTFCISASPHHSQRTGLIKML